MRVNVGSCDLESDWNFSFLILSLILTQFATGKWTVSEGEETFAMPGEKYLILSSEARKHGISHRLPSPVDFNGQTLVLQYEYRIQEQMNCGGAYIKLFPSLFGASIEDESKKSTNEFIPTKMNGSTPYVIMFGPDRCGDVGRVQLIYKYRNRLSGEVMESHAFPAMVAPWLADSPLTHLYRLEFNTANSSFVVKIDGRVTTTGSLLENMEPLPQPPKTIVDPKDKKPLDWVEDAEIDDPEDAKPENYDDTPAEIVDPEAFKPIEWDDELDGEWEPPMIPNPDYYGPWVPKRIKNPAYQGIWVPRQIANPHYYEEKAPGHFYAPIGGLGFELWSMQSGFMFTNIILTTNSSDADVLEELWRQKFIAESLIKEEIDWEHYPPFYRRWIDNALEFSQENPLLFGAICLMLGLPFIMWAIINTPQSKRRDPLIASDSSVTPSNKPSTSSESSSDSAQKRKAKKD